MTNNNPFGNFSFEDMMKQVQENPMLKAWQDSDFYKSLSGAQISDFDFKEIWELQKKNLDNLTQINEKLGENVKSLATKQAAVMSEAWETMKDYSADAVNSGEQDVNENMKKAQDVFHKATANIQELSRNGLEISEEMAENLQARMKETVKDLQDMIEKYRK